MTVQIKGKLKLRNYVFFAEMPEGVMFEAGARSFLLKGQNTYSFVAKILHLMDSGHAVEEILGRIPERLAPLANALFSSLSEHGMLIDADFDQRIHERFHNYPFLSEFLRYLEDTLGQDCSSKFEAWSDVPIRLFGGGYCMKAAVQCLLNSGCGPLSIYWLDDGDNSMWPSSDEVRDLLEAAALHREDHQLLSLTSADTGQSNPTQLIGWFTDGEVTELLSETGNLSVPPGAASVVGGSLQGKLVVAPVSTGENQTVDALRQWLRASADGIDQGHSPASYGIAGGIAALHLIRHFFAIDQPTISQYVTQVSPHLDLSQHFLFSQPGQLRAEPIPGLKSKFDYELPKERDLGSYEEIRLALDPLFDSFIGPFEATPSAHLNQLPLFHDAIKVRFPAPLEIADHEVIAWGTSVEDAGKRTLARALCLLSGVGQDQQESGLSADFEFEPWLNQAHARAAVASPQFASCVQGVLTDPHHIDEPVIQMLTRLLDYFGARPVHLAIYANETMPAVWAECRVGDESVASAIGLSPVDACIAALGQACSHYQVDTQGQWQDVEPRTQLPAPQADDQKAAAFWALSNRSHEFAGQMSYGLDPAVALNGRCFVGRCTEGWRDS